MPSATLKQSTLSVRSKDAIESIGTALLRQHTEPAAIDADRFVFELRVMLQRIFLLEAVGRLDSLLISDDAWEALLDLDLETDLFHGEQLGSDRIWSADWVGLVRREFGSCGGNWFAEVVSMIRIDSDQMGGVDESLMGWGVEIEGDQLRLIAREGSDRKTNGVFYTPVSVVNYVLDRALDPALEHCQSVDDVLSLRVCDPACGCGYFLVEAAKRIAGACEVRGGSVNRARVIRDCVSGCDINPLTAEICRWLLWQVAEDYTLSVEDLRSCVVCCDALEQVTQFDSEFDVVVGNPPFLNQLGSDTARSRSRVAKLRERGLIGGATYTDEACAFFVLGLQLASDGGRVCMVQPQSVIATRGGGWMRERSVALGSLDSLWVSNAHVFGDASVYTCAPCVRVGREQGSVDRFSGAAFKQHDAMRIHGNELASMGTWSPVASVTMGIPEIVFQSVGVVGDIARATADFRDEYYGLEGNIIEDGDDSSGIMLLTTGLVDLGRTYWGKKSTRILKQRWESPRVNPHKLRDDARLSKWVQSRGVEKVLVATQTRVIEAFVDERGGYAAVTPMISVMAEGEIDIWKLGAAIGSPVCTMHAMRHFGGAAMHADALKMSAKQVMELPLPTVQLSWDEGASSFERLHACETDSDYSKLVMQFGEVMCNAYQLVESDRKTLMQWWVRRLGINDS